MSNTPSRPTQTTAQLSREAKWSLYLTLVYLIGWVIFAYLMPDGTGIFGFPLWFELSCLLLPVLFILISFAVLKTVYQEIDLDADLTSQTPHDSAQTGASHDA